jgi:hypothetical protein
MAQVLAIVPTAGLDAVLVAWNWCWRPGRRAAAEHVLNVLARLNRGPAGPR